MTDLKAPWVLRQDELNNELSWVIRDADGYLLVLRACISVRDHAQMRAMHAAPDLLAAAQAAEGVIQWALDNGADAAGVEAIQAALRAAVAKAEGRV